MTYLFQIDVLKPKLKMQDVRFVEIFKRIAELLENTPNLLLWHWSGLFELRCHIMNHARLEKGIETGSIGKNLM